MYLVIAEQVWYLPGRQEVVDEHQEPLVGHLGVGHEEHGSQVLQPRLLVEVGQVELQVGAGVSLAQGDLKVITDFPAYSDTVYSDTPLTVTLLACPN